MAKTATSQAGKTYDRSVEEAAAKLVRKPSDSALRRVLSRRVLERAGEMSEYLIERARDRSVAGK